MPLFSIVIPTFNRLHSLKETVDSVWKQNFTDYELIVIDDGSTDGTANYLSNNSSRIKFKLRRNAGPSAARNAGIDMAVGDYVIFLDSDDLWFPWTLGTYAAAIESHKGPSIIIGSWLEVDAKDLGMLPAVATANKFIAYPDFLEASQHSIFWATNNVAIRRAAIGPSCRFDENLRVFEDKDLGLKLGAEPGFVKIDQPHTVVYRRTADSLSQNLPESFKGIIQVIKNERDGIYPGGAGRRWERRNYICLTARSVSRKMLDRNYMVEPMLIFRSTYCWNLGLRRFRYLLALPLVYFGKRLEIFLGRATPQRAAGSTEK